MTKICSQCAYFLPHGVAKLGLPAGRASGEDAGICALKAGQPGVEKGSYLVEGKQEACSSFELNLAPGNK